VSGTVHTQSIESESLHELVARLEPSMKEILVRYHVPEHHAGELLRDVLLDALYRGTGPGDAESCLLGLLRHRCRSYWQSRRHRFYRAIDFGAIDEILESREPVAAAAPRGAGDRPVGGERRLRRRIGAGLAAVGRLLVTKLP
jgi:hypothetical protein